MLNELHSLSDALNSMSIPTIEWYREYKPLPKVTAKTPCIRIWINADGSVQGLDNISAELSPLIRKYGNNQNSLPAFNIAPLYRVTNKEIARELEQVAKNQTLLDLDRIKSWCTDNNWRSSISKKVNNCLNKCAMELQEYIEQETPLPTNSVTALIRSLCVYSTDGSKKFRESLEAQAFAELRAGTNIGPALAVLFHKGNQDSKTPEKDSGSLSVMLDYAGWQEYGYPVASEEMTGWINGILLQSEETETMEGTAEGGAKDAFGLPLGNIREPMPSVRLPGFDVTLRTMFHEQHCQKRYGTFDNDSFPVAKQSRTDVKRALEYISAPDKKDVTWNKVDNDETIFAYPSKLAAIPVKFMALLYPPSLNTANTDERSKARFENCAKDFIKAFNGLKPQNRPDNIRIFSIRKMDKARSKIVFTRALEPEWYIKSAEEWQSGCKNIPEVTFIEPRTPFPLEVADIVNPVWKENGGLATQGKTDVKQMRYYQGVELLIVDEDKNKSEIHRYLSALINNSLQLFAFFGNLRPQESRPKGSQKYFSKALESLAVLCPLLGLLLYKNGYKKEDYMENAAYQIGQLLKVSDELHEMYCRVERKGDVPPQLAGNSMFFSALETPYRALAVLGQRMAPYISWANQYRTRNVKYDPNDEKLKENKDKSSGRAAHYKILYEDIAAKLAPVFTRDLRFDDFEKAQVFLGYLAASPKREKQNANETPVTNEDEKIVDKNTEEEQNHE
jgi:hypothetical protein